MRTHIAYLTIAFILIFIFSCDSKETITEQVINENEYECKSTTTELVSLPDDGPAGAYNFSPKRKSITFAEYPNGTCEIVLNQYEGSFALSLSRGWQDNALYSDERDFLTIGLIPNEFVQEQYINTLWEYRILTAQDTSLTFLNDQFFRHSLSNLQEGDAIRIFVYIHNNAPSDVKELSAQNVKLTLDWSDRNLIEARIRSDNTLPEEIIDRVVLQSNIDYKLKFYPSLFTDTLSNNLSENQIEIFLGDLEPGFGVGNTYIHLRVVEVNKALKISSEPAYIAKTDEYNFEEMTIEFWYKSENEGQQSILSSFTPTTIIDGITFPRKGWDISKIRNKISVFIGDSSIATNDIANLLNKWHHIAFSIDRSGNSIIYLDGASVASAQLDQTSINSDELLISIGLWNPDFLIDDIRIWNTVRTGQQIAENTMHEIQVQSGLVGNWKLNNKLKDEMEQSDIIYNNPVFVER